ncbi:MAG: FmdB family zinc ribbon protein [Acidobacteriota bacterium]
MPLYEYQCPDCGHRFEVLQRIGAGAEGVTCPRCERAAPEKKLSTFASAGSGEGAASARGCGAPSGFT